jgi:hypothetical protein
MATLTVTSIVEAGVAPTLTAAAALGDDFVWAENVFVYIINGDASSHTVTIASNATASPGLAVTDLAVAVPAGESRLIGPIDSAYKASDGKVSMTYDAVTSVTVKPFRV